MRSSTEEGCTIEEAIVTPVQASASRGQAFRAILWIAAAAALFGAPVSAQQGGANDLGLELVDSKVLRVCSDPSNMPFSNEHGEGFENKLAELMAAKLDKRLAYTWYPQSTGFVRQTLGSFRCDVIMGFPQAGELVQSTNPYYRSVYALVIKPGTELESVDTLADARLKDKRLGVIAGTPPATYLVADGLMPQAKPYPLVVDTRVDSSGRAMTKDIASGEVDAGILWGPIAAYYARQTDPPLRVVPLLKESGGPRLAYYITMGVRPADQGWKRTLNKLIADNQPALTKLLLDFGVPMLDDKDHLITDVPPAATP
jgi:quinoprotein dehydrogenase-associated probable ABC transporter substrate-binding protein